MSKILKNTTAFNIELSTSGFLVPMLGQLILDTQDFLLIASEESIDELTPLINLGQIIVNDGNSDLPPALGIDYLRYPHQAGSVLFDNSTNGFVSRDVQSAIEEAKQGTRRFYAQFQEMGERSNTDYLFAYRETGRRSGNSNNGYRFENSQPILCPLTGSVKEAVFAIKGLAVSTGTPAQNVTLNLELWSVGFNNEGAKLGDISVVINSGQFTIGNWWNTSVNTDYVGSVPLNIQVAKGDLLAVKFIRVQGNTDVVAIRNLTMTIEVQEGNV